MSKIISNSEVKAILGISGSANDALVEIWNEAALEILEAELKVSSLLTHSVTDERVEMVESSKLYLNDFPVDTTKTITVKNVLKNAITGLYFSKDNDSLRTVNIVDSNGVEAEIGDEEVFVSYTAGFTAQDTIDVISITDLVDKTISVTVAGVTTTYTFKTSGATTGQINIGATNLTAATNIASQLGGVAVGSLVTLPVGSSVALGTATSSQLTIVSATIPKLLKMAVALLVAGGILEQQKKGGISSYTIGGKTVNFRSEQDSNTFQQIVNKFASKFKKVSITSV